MATAQMGLTPEFVTAYRDMMLMSLSNELELTRKVLAAIPDGQRDYRPDPHARTCWELASHIAKVDIQLADGIADLKFGMEDESNQQPKTSSQLANWYGKELTRALGRVRLMSAAQLLTPIDFYGVLNLPAVLYLALFNNHSVHHRGQLSTYLRPMGSKCPSIYGGSYDEPWQGAARDE
ncbi:MAG: DinB family protein [Acidobacteria bacterium]|nr:DinB family protein [Acidobacteriota bacterium]